MAVLSWCAARCGGLSLISLFTLCLYVLFGASPWCSGPRLDHTPLLTSIFAIYSLFVHVCVLAFQLRACWAILESIRGLRKVTRQASLATSYPNQSWNMSSASLSNSGSSSPRSSRSSIDGWASGTESEDDLELVMHVILIPNYEEDIEVLAETLDVLSSHPQAKYAYDVYLAMEAREPGAPAKASQLVTRFKHKFRLLKSTFHPENMQGESPGKSSNLSWAAKRASEEYDLASRKDVIMTSIDADSHLSWRLFSEITAMHLAFPDTCSTTMYAAPIIFDRNNNQVPAVVRVADIAWCAAGLSGQYRGSSICPPTSVYSIPLELADRVGGWDTGPEAIGEDLHMWSKCFFTLNGNLIVRPVTCPVSQTNITGSRAGVIDGVKARYKQALRHMWGSLDSGYALRQLVQVFKRRHVMQGVYWPIHLSGKNASPEVCSAQATLVPIPSPNWMNMFFLCHRLFEAHFMPAHIFILVTTTSIYRYFGTSSTGTILWIFSLIDVLSFVGLCATIFFFCWYQTYYHLAVHLDQPQGSEREPSRILNVGDSRKSWRFIIDCAWLPVVATLYGSLPAIHAQLMHFWTMDLVYVVSNKPLRGKAG